MSLLMKALKKAEESQQGGPGADEPKLSELAEELSLEPAAPKPAKEKGRPAVDNASISANATAGGAANLFAAKEPHGGSRNSLLALLSLGALLLLAGGGAYIYTEINRPSSLTPVRQPVPQPVLAPSTVSPSSQAEQKISLPQGSNAVAPEAPEPLKVPQAGEKSPLPPTEPVAASKEPRAAAPASETAVNVQRGDRPEINPDLAQGYQALQEGRIEAARKHYQRLLQQEPRNLDALLGMGAVAARSNNLSEAGKFYLRGLEVEPRNTYAQAGLLSLLGSADPAGSEAKLKHMLAEQPRSFLYFALGNLYAGQDRWPDAQQAYFQAHHLEADNPDYAFNLAVSLEHINQPQPALAYYQRALQLLQGRNAGFERAAVEGRIAKLKRVAE